MYTEALLFMEVSSIIKLYLCAFLLYVFSIKSTLFSVVLLHRDGARHVKSSNTIYPWPLIF